MLMVEMIKKVRVVRIFVQTRGMVIWKNWVSRPGYRPDWRSRTGWRARQDMEAIYMTM